MIASFSFAVCTRANMVFIGPMCQIGIFTAKNVPAIAGRLQSAAYAPAAAQTGCGVLAGQDLELGISATVGGGCDAHRTPAAVVRKVVDMLK